MDFGGNAIHMELMVSVLGDRVCFRMPDGDRAMFEMDELEAFIEKATLYATALRARSENPVLREEVRSV